MADARERLRDALGTVRAVYAGAKDPKARAGLEKAGKAVAAALAATDEALAAGLDEAVRELDAAVLAAPWAAPGNAQGGARMLKVRGSR